MLKGPRTLRPGSQWNCQQAGIVEEERIKGRWGSEEWGTKDLTGTKDWLWLSWR